LNVTGEVDKTFEKLDTDKDGLISLDELKAGLDNLQQTYSDEELKLVMKVVDADKDHKISRKEL